MCLALGLAATPALAQTTTFTLTPTPHPVPENAGTVNVVITLSQGAPWDRFALYFSTRRHGAGSNQATPGTDFQHYSMRGGTEVQFLTKGDTKATVAVAITNDSDNEPDETFEFVVHDDADEGVLAPGSFPLATVITIQDDDAPVLSISADDADSRINEGEAAAFTVSLSAAQSTPLTVPVTVVETGSVLAANQPNSVVIAASQTSAALNIPLDNDNRDELDSTVTVTIALPSADYALGASTVTLTVADDDDEPSVSVAPGARGREGASLDFAVRLSAPSQKTLEVAYATADGTATAGVDYTAATGTLTFLPGQTEIIVAVPLAADDLDDTGETVLLNLTAVMGGDGANVMVPAGASATGTITEGLDPGQVKALNEAILPHIAASIGEETGAAIQSRVRAGFAGARPGAAVQNFGARNFDIRNFGAKNMGFAMGFGNGGEGEGAPSSVGVWAQGYFRDLSADSGAIDFDGEVTGVILGGDSRIGRSLLGLAVNHTLAEADWKMTDFTGSHETTLTGIHPYFGWQNAHGVVLWGSFGFARGEAEITDADQPDFRYKRDLALRTSAFGAYGPLLERGSLTLGMLADASQSSLKETGIEDDDEDEIRHPGSARPRTAHRLRAHPPA